jgi:TM2 domain-containing membrane protein YozV
VTPSTGPQEEPVVEVSAEELSPASPAAPAPVPPVPPVAEPALTEAPAAPHGDAQEVVLVQQPPAPVLPTPVTPEVAVAPPAPVVVVPAAPVAEAASPPSAYTPATPVTPVQPAPAVIAPPVVAEPVAAVPVEAPPAAVAPAAVAPAPVLATDQWYTSTGGQVYGPYSAEDIRGWLRSGQIAWDTQASRGEGDPWRPLSQIAEFNPAPVPAPTYAAPVGAPVATTPGAKDKTIAGILGILLGAFGGHHWYLGNYMWAGIYLGVTVITLGMLSFVPAIAGLVEGIMYLTAPDDKFQRNYKNWFLSGP